MLYISLSIKLINHTNSNQIASKSFGCVYLLNSTISITCKTVHTLNNKKNWILFSFSNSKIKSNKNIWIKFVPLCFPLFKKQDFCQVVKNYNFYFSKDSKTVLFWWNCFFCISIMTKSTLKIFLLPIDQEENTMRSWYIKIMS